MFRNFVVAIVLIFTVSGCAFLLEPTTSSQSKKSIELMVEEIKAANIGRHISEVIQKIGPPQNVASDEAGGKIYIWTNEKQVSTPQYSYVPVPQETQSYTPPKPQKSATQGEMWYNPYLGRFEWRSETRETSGNRIIDAINKGRENANSNPFVSGLKSQKKVVTGYTTQRRVESLMFFVNSDGTVYNVLYKDW